MPWERNHEFLLMMENRGEELKLEKKNKNAEKENSANQLEMVLAAKKSLKMAQNGFKLKSAAAIRLMTASRLAWVENGSNALKPALN